MTARVKELAGFIAPTTVLTALLIYFGFIGTQARFEYFGIYLDLTDLSNQDLLLYGLEVLYVPAAVIFLVLLVTVAVHAAVTWLLTVPARTGTCLTIAALFMALGVLLIARALIGLLVARVAQREIPGTTATALALGPVLLAYAAWISGKTIARRHNGSPSSLGTWYTSNPVNRLRRVGLFAVAGLVLAGMFWATNSFAWAFGQGRAYAHASKLPNQPEVVLDTKEPLEDLPDGVSESQLPPGQDRTYRYRYRNLRLLLEAGGRLFLVPEYWTDQGRTLIVPYDSQIRIQLIPKAPN